MPASISYKFEWVKSVLQLPESEALRIAGLDVFVILQSFRMMFFLSVALAVPALFILAPYYYLQSDNSSGLFDFSNYNINRVYSSSVWVPLTVALIATLICLHFIRVFLAGSIRTRQQFLSKPSYGAAFRILRQVTEGYGDLGTAREYFEISTRAVLVSSIPKTINQAKLKGILERASGGSVEKMIKVKKKAIEGLEKAVEERQDAIEELEVQLQKFNAQLKQSHNVDVLERLPVQERKELLLKLLTSGTNENEIKLQEIYQRCLKLDLEAQEALNAFNDNKDDVSDDEGKESAYDTNPFLEQTDSLLVTANVQIHKKQMKGMQGAVGGSVLAIMSTDRAARTLSQVLLSGNPFALQTQPAPPPNDFIWKNAALSPAERKSRGQLGQIYYILLHIAYAPITIFISNLSDLKKLSKSIPQLTNFANTQPIARATIQGVLCPFAMIFVMKFMIPIITSITHNEGHISHSEVQLRVFDRYSTFILVQTCIIGVIFSSFFEVYNVFLVENIPGVINLARELYPAKAHFFANALLQACCIDLCLEALRPFGVIKAAIYDPDRLTPPETPHENVRQEIRSWEPEEFEFGEMVAEAVMFPFHILMSFYLINPLCMLPALAYSAIAFLINKYNALYTFSAAWETGGRLWLKIAKQMTVGLVLMQFFGMVQFIYMAANPIWPTLLMLAMITGTVAYVKSLLNQVNRYEKFSSTLTTENHRPTAIMAQKQQELLKIFPPVDTFAIADARLPAEAKLDAAELPQKRLYEAVPFDLGAETKLFDDYDLDNNINLTYGKRAYSNPFNLEYAQVIYLPSKLPNRLKAYFAKD